MKKNYLISIVIIFIVAIQQSFGWRIEGPAEVCPGTRTLYKFYPEGGVICKGNAIAYLNGVQVDTESWSESTQIHYTSMEFYVDWPINNTGIGVVEFRGTGCFSISSDITGKFTSNVGSYPKLTLAPATLCSAAGTVTVTANSGSCTGTVYDWTAPTGWIFTSNNSNTIKSGPSVVTMKPTASANASTATVAATAIYPGGIKSNGGYGTVLYYATTPPVTSIYGPSSVCVNAPNGNYYFYDNDPYLSKEWSLAYDANPKAMIVGSTNQTNLYLDYINSATQGTITVNLKRTNPCGISSVSTKSVGVFDKAPVTSPPGVYGPLTVCNSGGMSYYTIGSMAWGIEYDVQPASAVAYKYDSGPYGQLSVDWVNTFTGTVTIKARSANPCGQSPWSPVTYVNVINGTCSNRTSELISGENLAEMELNASVYPNPSSSSSALLIDGPADRDINVQIINAQGSVVDEEYNVQSDNELQIGENLEPGIYVVKVFNGQTEKILKFVKQ
jgi:hypothetical protein